MRWMDVAWSQLGQAEVSGAAANPQIIDYFRGVGHAEVTSDEVAWCAAFVGWCLIEAGVPASQLPPADKRLLARSYLDFGTELVEPRVGAIAVFTRGSDKTHGHVGYVAGVTAEHIVLLGGNQANRVSTMHMPRSRLIGVRWPSVPATGERLAAAGSRTVVRSTRQMADGGKVTATQVLPTPPAMPSADALVAKGSALQGAVESSLGLAVFARERWPWIMAAVAAYYGLRMVWDAWHVRTARIEDHNTGANVARDVTQEADDAVSA